MNLLFDFITLQSKTGAAEYVRSVFFALLNEINTNDYSDIRIYALYDSSHGIAYEDLKTKNASTANLIFEFIDVYKHSICSIITDYHIDRLFIGCAQYLGNIPGIESISCETYCVVHDMVDEEIHQRNIDIFAEMLNPSFQLEKRNPSIKGFLQYQRHTLSFMNFFRKNRKSKWHWESRTKFIAEQYRKNPNFHLITVSEYSKKTIVLNCSINAEAINVLYPPERKFHYSSHTSNYINDLVKIGKIYLLLNADRNLKNPHNTIAAFKTYATYSQDIFLATVGYTKKEFKNHIPLPFLNDDDLTNLIKNCYALIYPSFFEGFGYPPIEAMKFGKPILATNVTSVPEILGDSAIYFSPLYTTSIYNALSNLTDNNYHIFAQKSKERYAWIKKKSEQDLKVLLNYIINGKNE